MGLLDLINSHSQVSDSGPRTLLFLFLKARQFCLLHFFVVFCGLILACCVMSLNKTIKEQHTYVAGVCLFILLPRFSKISKATG